MIDLMDVVGLQMSTYFQELDSFAMGAPVDWASPEPAPVWLDIAREYTERWHHQQHIRDTVNKPCPKQPRHFAPVLESFMYAFPWAYHDVSADENTSVTLSIAGR